MNTLKSDIINKSRTSFKDFLATKSLRITNQRMAIFDAAFNHIEHFTAEELLDFSRKIDPSVSRATVYRTLPILTESGLVKEIDIGHDNKFYLAHKGQKNERAQIVCLDCEKIFEIDAPFLEWYGNTVSEKLGLKPETQRLQVHAHCLKLKDLQTCENKEDRMV